MNNAGIKFVVLGLLTLISPILGSEGGYFFNRSFSITLGILIVIFGIYKFFEKK